jgi:hypothetical protein
MPDCMAVLAGLKMRASMTASEFKSRFAYRRDVA